MIESRESVNILIPLAFSNCNLPFSAHQQNQKLPESIKSFKSFKIDF
jgi:hypothetical protein